MENQALKNQLNELIAEKQQKNQSFNEDQANFGRINTQDEQVLIDMINAQVEKELATALQQKNRKSVKNVQHPGVTCNKCNTNPLMGVRYQSLKIDGFNICEACESQH